MIHCPRTTTPTRAHSECAPSADLEGRACKTLLGMCTCRVHIEKASTENEELVASADDSGNKRTSCSWLDDLVCPRRCRQAELILEVSVGQLHPGNQAASNQQQVVVVVHNLVNCGATYGANMANMRRSDGELPALNSRFDHVQHPAACALQRQRFLRPHPTALAGFSYADGSPQIKTIRP